MKQKMVGVRELKSNLSSYLREVKNGRTILITERGEPVCQIAPLARSVQARLQELARAGTYTWSGKRLKAGKPLKVKISGNRMLSDIVLENRD